MKLLKWPKPKSISQTKINKQQVVTWRQRFNSQRKIVWIIDKISDKWKRKMQGQPAALYNLTQTRFRIANNILITLVISNEQTIKNFNFQFLPTLDFSLTCLSANKYNNQTLNMLYSFPGNY